jgi:phospholipid N-methyltransferase
MNNKGALLKELFTNLSTTGAITFSSKPLVNKMLSYADFHGAKLLVELGGGDGSITQGIVERMDPDAVLLVFEINRPFCDNLEKIFPQDNIRIICDSAENIDHYLEGKKANLILSSLPLTLIPKSSREEIYRKCKGNIVDNGKLIQICYSYLLKFQFGRYFEEIKSHLMFKNFPPTFILVCE